MSNSINALEKISSWLLKNKHKYRITLQSGLSLQTIIEYTKKIELTLPEEICDLYQSYNGTKEDTPFFPGFRFFPLHLAIEIYIENINLEEKRKGAYQKNHDPDKLSYVESWNQYWFPIFELGSEFYFIDCSDNPQKQGAVYNYYPEYVYPTLMYKTLSDMMSAIYECYETGAYHINNEGFLDEDEDRVTQIQEKYYID